MSFMTADSTPQNRRTNTKLPGLEWKLLVGLWLCVVIVAAFKWVHGAFGFTLNGNAGRLIFFHVPQAELTFTSFMVATWFSIVYLAKRRNREVDRKIEIAMELGFLFCVLATITGSMFAGVMWGSYWNWDPREISIVIMLLIYAAYLVLRSAVVDSEQRAMLSAAYVLISIVPAIFLIWVIPRIPALGSLHPSDTLFSRQGMSPRYKIVFWSSFLGFLGVYVWLFQIRLRLARLQERKTERELIAS